MYDHQIRSAIHEQKFARRDQVSIAFSHLQIKGLQIGEGMRTAKNVFQQWHQRWGVNNDSQISNDAQGIFPNRSISKYRRSW